MGRLEDLKAKNTPVDGKRFQFILGEQSLNCTVFDLIDASLFSGDHFGFRVVAGGIEYILLSPIDIDSTNLTLFEGLFINEPEVSTNTETEYFKCVYYLSKIYVVHKLPCVVSKYEFPDDGMSMTSSTYNDSYILKYAPDGWDKDEYQLVRDMSYYGVFRKFTVGELMFVKDGRDYLVSIYEAGGVNAKCKITVVETLTTGTTRNRFVGYIDFSTYKRTELSVDVQIIDGSFTDLVLNRKNQEVNLLGTKSVDWVTIPALTMTEIIVPEININEVGTWEIDDTTLVLDENHSLQIKVVNSEYPEGTTVTGLLFGKFLVDATEDYLDTKFTIVISAEANGNTGSAHFTWSFHLDRWAGGVLSEADLWTDSFESTGAFHMSIEVNEILTADIYTGDSLVLRAEIVNDIGTGDIRYDIADLKLETNIETLPDRLIRGVLYHEAFDRIVEIYTGTPGLFKSDFFGRTDIGYDVDGQALGCLLTGRYIRGRYGMNTTIPVSLEQLFKSVQSIYNLGMGVEFIDGVEKIVIEPMSYFFSPEIILDISNRIAPETIGKEYYPELAFNRINVGYNSYDYRSLGGIYEYNTTSKFTTCIKPVDKVLDIVSGIRADMSGMIELIKEPIENKDVSGESDLFFIDTIRDGTDYIVRTSEGFEQAEDQSNRDTMFNLIISPARNLIRWGSYLRGCLEKYLTSLIIWQTSDKNTKLSSTVTGGTEVKENTDVLVYSLSTPLWHPEIFTFEVNALETDIEVIKANQYGLIKITDTEYGWILSYRSKNENKMSEFTLLRCNTDYVTPEGDPPVYPADLFIKKQVLDLPDNDQTFRVTITGDNGVVYSNMPLVQGVNLLISNVPYGTYTITESESVGYSLVSILPATVTIDSQNLHGECEVTNSYVGVPETIKYGALYNWYDIANVARNGYEVPEDTDYTTLRTYLGGTAVAGGKLKEMGLDHWITPNTGATNEVNFNARGSGQRSSVNGLFANLGTTMSLWTRTELSVDYAYIAFCFNNSASLFVAANLITKGTGFTIRLIKTTPTVEDLAKADGEACDNYFDGEYYYRTVKIGTQVWTADNIKTRFYTDGSPIPVVTSDDSWAALTTSAMCSYNNDDSNL